MIKFVYSNPTTSIIFNSEILNTFAPISQAIPTTSIKHYSHGPSQCWTWQCSNIARKNTLIKAIKIANEEFKLSLFTVCIILHIKNSNL